MWISLFGSPSARKSCSFRCGLEVLCVLPVAHRTRGALGWRAQGVVSSRGRRCRRRSGQLTLCSMRSSRSLGNHRRPGLPGLARNAPGHGSRSRAVFNFEGSRLELRGTLVLRFEGGMMNHADRFPLHYCIVHQDVLAVSLFLDGSILRWDCKQAGFETDFQCSHIIWLHSWFPHASTLHPALATVHQCPPPSSETLNASTYHGLLACWRPFCCRQLARDWTGKARSQSS